MKSDLELVLPACVFEDIKDIGFEAPHGFETGVALFGIPVTDPSTKRRRHVVLAVSGPGPRATHKPSLYSSDTDYTSAIFRALQRALPSIRWLGELHLHPAGMAWLSHGDRQTVRQLLSGTAGGTVRPHEFIAGVMQRKGQKLDLHPVFFDKKHMDGVPLPIEQVPSTGEVVHKARSLAAADPAPEPKAEASYSQTPTRLSVWRKSLVIFRRRKKL